MVADPVRGLAQRRTSIIGSCPLTPTLRDVFFMSTTMSLPFKFAGTDIDISRSCIVCVHLYGSLACSSFSLARSSLSFFSRSSGVGEVDMVKAYSVLVAVEIRVNWSTR